MPESEPTPIPERIDLSRAEDPRDVVHRAVACLAQGGVVGLPTESGYALAAGALQPLAVARLVRDAARDEPGPLPMLLSVKAAEELADWIPTVPVVARRLARRSWPGPVSLELGVGAGHSLLDHLPPGVRAAVTPQDRLTLRCPDHPVLVDILHLIPGPLVLVEGTASDPLPPATSEALGAGFVPDMLLDDGPVLGSRGVTAVGLEGESWAVRRAGAVDAGELQRRAALVVVFVCTGNTCRSPMAEALCRDLLARRLGCPASELAGRGYVVLSAGVGAYDGMPAATEAIEVIGPRGGSLRDHSSRRVTPELLRRADLIVAMTRDHRDILVGSFPEVAGSLRLLDAEGGDIDDPIGEDLDTYRRTANQIEGHLGRMIDDLVG